MKHLSIGGKIYLGLFAIVALGLVLVVETARELSVIRRQNIAVSRQWQPALADAHRLRDSVQVVLRGAQERVISNSAERQATLDAELKTRVAAINETVASVRRSGASRPSTISAGW